MSVYYCESCLTNQGTYVDGGDLPIALPGQPNVGFNIGTGFNNGVQTIELQSDGKILVGGYFNEFKESDIIIEVRFNVIIIITIIKYIY